MAGASREDREYFARVAAQNRALEDEAPPRSLAEVLDRMEAMRAQLGSLAIAGVSGEDDGDLDSHLAYLARCREIRKRGAQRT